MNFAEQLVYWYLRFNGFFPLMNFVMHYQEGHPTRDADVLAVRFPNVSEDVGGQPHDWDPRFEEWGVQLDQERVGLIVEVKSGRWNAQDLNADHARRVRNALRRLGMLAPEQLDWAADGLTNSPMLQVADCVIAKLFVGECRPRETIPWLCMRPQDVERFVCDRLRRYGDRKRGDRFFFPGELIQYLAWKAGHQV